MDCCHIHTPCIHSITMGGKKTERHIITRRGHSQPVRQSQRFRCCIANAAHVCPPADREIKLALTAVWTESPRCDLPSFYYLKLRFNLILQNEPVSFTLVEDHLQSFQVLLTFFPFPFSATSVICLSCSTCTARFHVLLVYHAISENLSH